jgi:hypothetical protein
MPFCSLQEYTLIYVKKCMYTVDIVKTKEKFHEVRPKEKKLNCIEHNKTLRLSILQDKGAPLEKS